MNHIFRIALALAGLCLAASAPAQAPSAEQKAREQQLTAILESLHPVSGDVSIPQASAILHLGKDYYYLPPDEARKVLVDGWGNPPDTADGVLGMVFPAGKTFLDDVWGAVITYEPSGYVSDEDAAKEDYGALLKQLQEGTEAGNPQRTEQGYPAQHLIGWAQAPAYDARSHSMIWARNVSFDGQPENTLSYDVRLLGRKGVLSLNMITGMSKLEETRRAAAKFAASAEFQAGSRYADYQPGTDKKAEYGLAGLVAAGAGVAVAKKLGLLGIILAFGKKFLVVIIALLAGIFAWFRRRSDREEPEADYAPASYETYDEPLVQAPDEGGAAATAGEPEPGKS
jgi:uncharacterized membrane-anchored protein